MEGNPGSRDDPAHHHADELKLMEAGTAQGGESQIVPAQLNLDPTQGTLIQPLPSGSVAIGGGEFHGALLGPQTNNVSSHAGITGGYFGGAHIGPVNNYYINKANGSQPQQGQPSSLQQEGNSARSSGYHDLTPSIRMFPGKPLTKTLTARIFEGEMRSGTLGTRLVVVKVVNYSEKNCREAKNLVKLLPHTNVVNIIASDVLPTGLGKRMYIVMDRCQTLNLEEYIKNRKSEGVPFNLQEAVSHARQVVDAIHHIHSCHIVHRDLKPTSVLFSLCGKHLKIVDFGVSKQLENGRSVMSVSMLKVGTDGYRAPETYLRNELSKKADIFSLGLVLFHLWSYGLHPFGTDPEIWNFNIKNKCQGLDMSGLLLPNPKNAKLLLEEMFKFVPEERIAIDGIKNHIAVRQEASLSVTDTMRQIWNGSIQGAEYFECTVYQMPNNPAPALVEADWTFVMNAVPRVNMVSMKKIVDKTPSGYIATLSRKELKKMIEDFTAERKMGWANIYSSGGENLRVLLLICSPDFPELFGIFVEDPENFRSQIQGLISNDQLDPEDFPDPERIVNPAEETDFPSLAETAETPEISQGLSVENLLTEPPTEDLNTAGTDLEQVIEPSRTERLPSTPTIESKRHGIPELIPWWYFPAQRKTSPQT